MRYSPFVVPYLTAWCVCLPLLPSHAMAGYHCLMPTASPHPNLFFFTYVRHFVSARRFCFSLPSAGWKEPVYLQTRLQGKRRLTYGTDFPKKRRKGKTMKTFLSNNPLQGMPKDKLPTIHNLILLTSQGFASEPDIFHV